MKLPLLLIATAVVLSACGPGGPGGADGSKETEKAPEHADHVEAPPAADCSAAGGDSARAVCLAARPEFPDSARRRVFEVVRRGDTICVVTGPGDAMTLDGMARTSVVRGEVVEKIEADSIGCR